MLALSIYIVIVADVLLTGYGIIHGYVVEINPIAVYLFYWNVPMACAGVLVVTGASLGVLAGFERRIRSITPCLWGLLAVRLLAMGPHVYWLVMMRT